MIYCVLSTECCVVSINMYIYICTYIYIIYLYILYTIKNSADFSAGYYAIITRSLLLLTYNITYYPSGVPTRLWNTARRPPPLCCCAAVAATDGYSFRDAVPRSPYRRCTRWADGRTKYDGRDETQLLARVRQHYVKNSYIHDNTSPGPSQRARKCNNIINKCLTQGGQKDARGCAQ